MPQKNLVVLWEGKDMPKVSVIIPVYNVEKYLIKCLNSVVNQTFNDIEIICIDDASTDNSFSILCTYAKKDARIRLIRNPKNIGLGATRNIGIDMANSEYLLFVDSDDWIDLTTIEDLYETCYNKNLDVGFFNFTCIYENNTVKQNVDNLCGTLKGVYSDIYTGMQFFKMLCKNDEYIGLIVCALYKTQYLRINNIRFVEGFIHEDVFFRFKVLALATRVCHFPLVRYFYYRNLYSITARQLCTANFLGVFVAYAHFIEFISMKNFDMEYLDCLDFYLTSVCTIMNKYFLYVKNKNELEPIKTLPCNFQVLFKNYILSKNRRYLTKIFCDEIEKIRHYRYIIVYGAGRVAHETIEVLRQYGIYNILIAVTTVSTHTEKIYGLDVKNIRNLSCPKDKSVVLLATTSKYHSEMRDVLNELGYYMVMTMTDQ